jgi:sugar phosphate isomerase/epimerase
MKKHKGRLKLLHIKQISKDKHGVDVDKGVLDFKKIIKKAQAAGAEQFILEQEEFEVSSMVSVKNDVESLKKLQLGDCIQNAARTIWYAPFF